MYQSVPECTQTASIWHVPITKTLKIPIILATPEWIKKPESQNKTVGENVTFQCLGSGEPEPEVEWRVNGKPLTSEYGYIHVCVHVVNNIIT